jgi:hypothetical protein
LILDALRRVVKGVRHLVSRRLAGPANSYRSAVLVTGNGVPVPIFLANGLPAIDKLIIKR